MDLQRYIVDEYINIWKNTPELHNIDFEEIRVEYLKDERMAFKIMISKTYQVCPCEKSVKKGYELK